MMRALTLSLALFGSSPVAAAPPHLMPFEQALEAYDHGRLEAARAAFRHLAELGDTRARFNLGVMLLKGEGGPAEHPEALAWIAWAAEEDHKDAPAALEAAQNALAPDTIEAAHRTRAELHSLHALESLLDSEGDGVRYNVAFAKRCMQRKPPRYPKKAVDAGQVGYAQVHFLISPEGNLDAVQALSSLIADDPFAGEAERAMRRWSARDCPPDNFTYSSQLILFELGERTDYSESTRAWAARALQQARAGDAGAAYAVATIDDLQDGLFALEAYERERLLLRAAVAGIPEAMVEMANRLGRVAPWHAERWRWLAADRGYGPALFWVAHSSDAEENVRHAALLRAADSGFLPGVFLAATALASHPDPACRNGAKALRLTSALPAEVLRNDTSMIETHAAALAENGQFADAERWQKRALKIAKRLKRDTTLLERRLLAYQEERPWREDATRLRASACPAQTLDF